MILRRLIAGYLTRAIIAYALLMIAGYAAGYSQPSWLTANKPPQGVANAPPEAVEKPKTITKTVERVKYDTITIIQIDTIIKVDTLHPPKPLYYIYTIYYEILDKKLTMNLNFSWDFSKTAQKTILQSSDTTLLSLGNESLRSSGFTYDNFGNKMETLEKIIEGLDMRILGKKVNITYRTGFNLLTLDGFFDDFGLLQLNSDFSRRRYFLYFIPIDFLFGSEKYTLFLRIEKKEAK
ncbi:MAG: hypothetical protein LBU89_09390 [Fibromonadaceae bacterium]|jgi:hypothetical protein|nr:hypothetical protein [Fibromonadaceae bacterium]